MNIFVYNRTKNFTSGFSETCYGPFNSMKGAKLARDYCARIDSNTGQYFNTSKIIRRKHSPEFRTITWSDFCACQNRFLMEDKLTWHL